MCRLPSFAGSRLWTIPVEEAVLLRIAGAPVVKQSLLQDMVSWQLFGELFVPAAVEKLQTFQAIRYCIWLRCHGHCAKYGGGTRGAVLLLELRACPPICACND